MKKLFFTFVFLFSMILSAQKVSEPKFTITDINGQKITVIGTKDGLKFPDFKNKVVLIEFWGTHCPPCLYSINHYVKLNKKYKGKMEMLAVEVQMTPAKELKSFVKKMGINYHVFAQTQVSDFLRYVGQRAGWSGAIPFLIAFDKNGNPIDIHVGYAQEKYVEALIQFGLKGIPKNSKENNNSKVNTSAKKTNTKNTQSKEANKTK